jgi:hypothetical protein
MRSKRALWLLLPLALMLGPAVVRAELEPQGELMQLSEPQGAELPVTVRIRVAADTATAPPVGMPATRVLPVTSWRADGSAIVGEVAAGPTLGGLLVSLRWQHTAEGAYSLQAEAQVQSALWLGILSVELELPDGAANIGGRELRLRQMGRTAALSGLDPKWLIVRPRLAETPHKKGAQPAWTLLLDDESDGIQLLREGAHLLTRIELFSTETRPFSHFVSCTDNWRAPNHRESLPVRLLQPDEPLHAELTLYSGTAIPLFKARYPDGRDAALVITDHADQTAAVTLRALIGGTSDMTSSRWGQGGLIGHGLNITKSLWMSSGEPAPPPLLRETASAASPHHLGHSFRNIMAFRNRYGRPQVDSTGGGRPQLDDPEVAEMAERMARVGWEIVPHSATPLRDERDRTEAALEWFARYKARTWIDHQPYTNCEALVNEGYKPGPFGIIDLLQKFSYSYAWSGIDLPPGSLNLLSPRRLDRFAPVLWPAGRLSSGMPTGLWLFSTMMTYVDNAKFFKLYAKRAIDQLERERGLHIAHTYLEAFHPPTSPFVKRNLMMPGKHPGEVVPDPKLDALFQSLADRVAGGSLWVPTLGQLGDYMRAMAAVSVRLQADGSAVLRSPQALSGATFVLPRPGLKVLIDGQPPKGQRLGHKETIFWIDLPADRDVHVMLLDAHGEMVVFRHLPEGKSLLARRLPL